MRKKYNNLNDNKFVSFGEILTVFRGNCKHIPKLADSDHRHTGSNVDTCIITYRDKFPASHALYLL